MADIELGTTTEILSLPAGTLSYGGTPIYQGQATLVYNVKFAIMVILNSENLGIYTLDCVIGAQGNSNYTYHVRELTSGSASTSLFIQLSVNNSGKQWAIKASSIMTPLSLFGLQVSLQSKGIIVFRK